ncbi:hypothetical protein DFQ14_101529 [Halopolyspora algeriensis]|uniref:Uncharacterized protein n=1 Tax=Halopolyspora algeriensis TaxID=1500506 RepID=A0A368W1V2_9ACTN|nr:hypothetical protein [Halopolyspora algeriensis]RCW47184.1 hypothetical protein DFQ14_101529 [Halopolyspora algeriensis]TQM48270.1 hypothetical protein FHU43_3235 [Halopolyspora algeriensis]
MQTTVTILGALVPIMAASMFYLSDHRVQQEQQSSFDSEQD